MRKPPWVPRSRRVDRARKENSWLRTGTTSSACLRNLGENTEKASRGLGVERCLGSSPEEQSLPREQSRQCLSFWFLKAENLKCIRLKRACLRIDFTSKEASARQRSERADCTA